MKDDNDRAREGTLPRDPAEGAEPMPKGEEQARSAAAELLRRWEKYGKLAPDTFTTAPPEPKWLLTRGDRSKSKNAPGALRLGKVGMLVAAGGVGKTQALVLLAIAVATFRKPTLEELEELTSSGNRGEEESRLAPIRQCLTKFLVGAEGIGDEGGSDRDAAEQVSIATNEAEFALPTHGEFWRCVNAMAEVKKGN